MDIVTFFEKLASNAHYNKVNVQLVDEQNVTIKDYYLNNDNEALKKHISKDNFFNNESHVVKI